MFKASKRWFISFGLFQALIWLCWVTKEAVGMIFEEEKREMLSNKIREKRLSPAGVDSVRVFAWLNTNCLADGNMPRNESSIAAEIYSSFCKGTFGLEYGYLVNMTQQEERVYREMKRKKVHKVAILTEKDCHEETKVRDEGNTVRMNFQIPPQTDEMMNSLVKVRFRAYKKPWRLFEAVGRNDDRQETVVVHLKTTIRLASDFVQTRLIQNFASPPTENVIHTPFKVTEGGFVDFEVTKLFQSFVKKFKLNGDKPIRLSVEFEVATERGIPLKFSEIIPKELGGSFFEQCSPTAGNQAVIALYFTKHDQLKFSQPLIDSHPPSRKRRLVSAADFESGCTRIPLMVNFTELGFENITVPTVMDIGQCAGTCHYPLPNGHRAPVNAKLRAYISTLYHRRTPPSYSPWSQPVHGSLYMEPSCVPIKYGGAALKYGEATWKNGPTTYQYVEQFVVQECGCR